MTAAPAHPCTERAVLFGLLSIAARMVVGQLGPSLARTGRTALNLECLAQRCRLPVPTVEAALTEMENFGLLRVDASGGFVALTEHQHGGQT